MVESIEGVQGNSGESELRIRLDNLNKIASERQQQVFEQAALQPGPSGKERSLRDVVKITPEASVIAGSGLDKANSTIRRTGDLLEFNLRFDTDKFSEMTTKGSFSPASRQMSLFVSFNFKDNIQTDKGEENRTYNARVKLEANNVGPDTFSLLEGSGSKLEKNIDNMLARMLERAYQKQYPPLSVVLKLDDIADLVSEKGGLFQKVSRAMMLLNSTLARALEGGGSAALGPQVIEQTDGSSLPEGTIELKDFSFHLKDITPAIGPGSGQPAAEIAVGSRDNAAPPPPSIGGNGGGDVAPTFRTSGGSVNAEA